MRGEDQTMATIQEEILESFYAELAKSCELDAATIENLRELFESERKLKADDFVAVLSRAEAHHDPN